MFSPGDLVIYVDDRPCMCGCYDGLRLRGIYTIKDTFVGYDLRNMPGHGVTLVEQQSPAEHSGFWAERFRPVDRNKLSVFTAMLAPQEIERAKELIRLEDAVQASLTEVDEIAAAEAIERDISG